MKYNKGTIYSGTLMQHKNEENIKVKENVWLAYSEEEDCFYNLEKTLNPSIDLLNPNLSKELLEEYQRIVDEHKYPYKNNGIEGNMYIDENTIKVEVEQKNSKVNRG